MIICNACGCTCGFSLKLKHIYNSNYYCYYSVSRTSQAAFVYRHDLTEDSGSDILVVGGKDRNRAVHGDEVVVDIFPKSQWRTRSLAVKIVEENEVEGNF